MLQLTNIRKTYKTGALQVEALRDISLEFGKGEFVAVLGPSGCGKTTLLNIIGGLDRYDAGDMRILGRSTRDYTEKEMDAYRNHAVGFVFQAYNLIVHQSVLANVELALTLTGISKKERRQKALKALDSVGLADQVHKKPGQLSGGQMQRVAIARAMVNNPDILLADEPTGALDSATSEQVLDLLKELAKDRLVIMVTHNQELARRYATRIIQLKDGLVVSDSRPASAEPENQGEALQKKTAMGFGTALSLSLNNLLTKRGRTLITAFAGSIGIIGIALILALSNGVNQYILNVQKSTMSSYPITIEEEAIQLDGMMDAARDRRFPQQKSQPLDRVYLNTDTLEHRSQMQATFAKNNLTSFKAYLEQAGNPITPHVSEVRFGYNASFDLYTFDREGDMRSLSGAGSLSGFGRAFSGMMPFDFSSLTEISPSSSDGLVSDAFREKHTLLAGEWPRSANELLLMVNAGNELSETMLYQLGLLTQGDLTALQESGESRAQPRSWAYEDLLGLPVRLLAGSDAFVPSKDGTYQNLHQEQDALKALVEQAPLLTVTGIIRETDGNNQRRGGLYYTRALTDLVILRSAQSPVVLAQQAREEVSILTGLHFNPADDAQKAADLKRYYTQLSGEQLSDFVKKALRLFPEVFKQDQPEQEKEASGGLTLPEGMSMEQILAMMRLFTGGTSDEMPRMPEGGMELLKQWGQMSGITLESMGMGDEKGLAMMVEGVLNSADESTLAQLYDQLVRPDLQSLEATYRELGRVNLDMPTSITLYMDTFEQKETITRLIQEYNSTASEGDQIAYTDFVALMISGVTNIVNVISYVLIAFVAVSLVVSSIMIGIITYISVLERTKEIGILRSVGASRKDVGRVFTAEAFIIGLGAGALGILISALLIIPINQIIYMLSNDATVKAILPPAGAVILIGISALLSLIAGFLPSRIAARKDPVECLRAE